MAEAADKGPSLYKRSRKQLITEFYEQRQALWDFCVEFDKGFRYKAKYIAGVVYVLLYDGGKNNNSLMREIGIRNCFDYVSSGQGLPTGELLELYKSASFVFAWNHPLVVANFDGKGGVSYDPICYSGFGGEGREMSFDRWWHEKIFVTQDFKHSLSRKELTHLYRSKDGLGHYDTEVTSSAHNEIAHGSPLHLIVTDPQGEVGPLLGIRESCMRQIGEELLLYMEKLVAAGLPADQ